MNADSIALRILARHLRSSARFFPRSAHPETVFHGMWAAAEYARTRLGGQIVTLDGHLADFQKLGEYVRQEAEELRSIGFTPGTSEALRFF